MTCKLKAILKMLANNTFIEHEDAPHGFFYPHKERLNSDLIAFLKEDAGTFNNNNIKSTHAVNGL